MIRQENQNIQYPEQQVEQQQQQQQQQPVFISQNNQNSQQQQQFAPVYQNPQLNQQQSQQPQQNIYQGYSQQQNQQQPQQQSYSNQQNYQQSLYQQPQQYKQQQIQIKETDLIKTTHQVFPYQLQTVKSYKLPIGLVVSAHGHQDDGEIPLLNFNEKFKVNPPRCLNCRAFCNCYNSFTSSGKMVCALCGLESNINQAIANYYLSTPHETIPELTNEAMDILAPDDYKKIKGQRDFTSYVFVIQISELNMKYIKYIQKGLLAFLEASQDVHSMIGFILSTATQNNVAMFRSNNNFELKTALDQSPVAPKDTIVEMRARHDSVQVFLQNLENICIELLEQSQSGVVQSDIRDKVIYDAITLGQKQLYNVSGKIVVFGNIQGQQIKKQTQLFNVNSKLNETLTEQAVIGASRSISCNFLQFVQTGRENLDNIIEFITQTNGFLHYINQLDEQVVAKNIQTFMDIVLDQNIGYQSCIRIRKTPGLEIKTILSSGKLGALDLVNFAQSSDLQEIGYEITLSKNEIPINSNQYVQLSYIYSNVQGDRIIRVVTKPIYISDSLKFVESINVSTQLALVAKKCAYELLPQSDYEQDKVQIMSFDQAAAIASIRNDQLCDYSNMQKLIYGEASICLKYVARNYGYQSIQQLSRQYQTLLYYLFGLGKCGCFKPQSSRITLQDRQISIVKFLQGSEQNILSMVFPSIYSIGEKVSQINLDLNQILPTQITLLQGLGYIYVIVGQQVNQEIIKQICADQQIIQNKSFKINTTHPLLSQVLLQMQSCNQYQSDVIGILQSSQAMSILSSQLINNANDGISYIDFIKWLEKSWQAIQ